MFSAAVAGDSDVESNNSDGDGDEEDEEVLGEGLDAASDEEELELGPEHGETPRSMILTKITLGTKTRTLPAIHIYSIHVHRPSWTCFAWRSRQ